MTKRAVKRYILCFGVGDVKTMYSSRGDMRCTCGAGCCRSKYKVERTKFDVRGIPQEFGSTEISVGARITTSITRQHIRM